MTDEIEANNSLFNYHISQGKDIFVISLTGVLNGKATKQFQECLAKIEEADCRFLVLNFKDTTHIDSTAYRHLVQLQHSVRKDKGKAVRLCGINPSWKSLLVDNGIIRGSEIVDSMRAALLDIKKLI